MSFSFKDSLCGIFFLSIEINGLRIGWETMFLLLYKGGLAAGYGGHGLGAYGCGLVDVHSPHVEVHFLDDKPRDWLFLDQNQNSLVSLEVDDKILKVEELWRETMP
ncbi:hypothetical protein VNO80_20503 [Phaseolus coccineus]|uniref:Uncharacterized protein n=1 Tax=Phaseolus coccineus TaxID=3886 RepID=A0AAN9M0P0_PHACN